MGRRRWCASSPWTVWLVTLWIIFVFAFPLFLFKFVFRFRSPFFYVAYASILVLLTYVAFTEKVRHDDNDDDPRPPAQHLRAPPPPPPSQTVDVDMPVFDSARFQNEAEDGSAEQCAICLSHYVEADRPVLSLPTCQHHFHVECVEKWLRSHGRCPICSACACPLPTTGEDPPLPQPHVVRVSVAVDAANNTRGDTVI